MAEDRELAAALQSRDRDRVLDVLYRFHSTRVYRFCLRLVGEPAVAEELAQEAFVATLSRVGWLRRPVPPALRAFLYRTAHRLSVTRARRKSAERRALRRLERQPAALQSEAAGPAGPERPESRIDAQRVRTALGRLAERDRAVLLLWAEAELPLAEVARVLEVPESTCRDHFRRALDTLAADLGQVAPTAATSVLQPERPAAELLGLARTFLGREK